MPAKAPMTKSILKLTVVSAAQLLVGCTATMVRWDSMRMREEITAYYNDEIMDNLVRMKQGLPFIHVDVSSVSAAVLSQISGNIGGGESDMHSNTSPSAAGGLVAIAKTIARPFTYSFTPTHSDNLTITAVPVIGQLPVDNTESSPRTNRTSPRTTTIYSIYDKLGAPLIIDGVLVYSQVRPGREDYVSGTLKKSGLGYYYIQNSEINKDNYTTLFRALFTQTRRSSSKLSATEADVETIKAQGTTGRPQ